MNRRVVRYALHLLILLGLLPGLTGCTNPLSRSLPSEEAPVANEITIYTPMTSDRIAPYLQLFSAEHPDIQVNVVFIATGNMLDRLLAEQEAPQADIVWGLSVTVATLLQWHDLITPYSPEGVERIYTQFRDTERIPNWVGFGAWMSVFCVNPALLAEHQLPRPETWENLFDPIYAGHLALPSPTTSGTGAMIIDSILDRHGAIKGWNHLDALDSNVKVYTITNSRPCEMVADGEVAVGASAELAPIELAASGKPIETIFPTGGTGWDIEANALVRRDDTKDAAKVFLDWAISDDAMREYGKTRSLLAMDLDGYVPPYRFPQEPLALIYDKDFPWASANRDRTVAEWVSRYGAKIEQGASDGEQDISIDQYLRETK